MLAWHDQVGGALGQNLGAGLSLPCTVTTAHCPAASPGPLLHGHPEGAGRAQEEAAATHLLTLGCLRALHCSPFARDRGEQPVGSPTPELLPSQPAVLLCRLLGAWPAPTPAGQVSPLPHGGCHLGSCGQAMAGVLHATSLCSSRSWSSTPRTNSPTSSLHRCAGWWWATGPSTCPTSRAPVRQQLPSASGSAPSTGTTGRCGIGSPPWSSCSSAMRRSTPRRCSWATGASTRSTCGTPPTPASWS